MAKGPTQRPSSSSSWCKPTEADRPPGLVRGLVIGGGGSGPWRAWYEVVEEGPGRAGWGPGERVCRVGARRQGAEQCLHKKKQPPQDGEPPL